jgi:hypothetical protein
MPESSTSGDDSETELQQQQYTSESDDETSNLNDNSHDNDNDSDNDNDVDAAADDSASNEAVVIRLLDHTSHSSELQRMGVMLIFFASLAWLYPVYALNVTCPELSPDDQSMYFSLASCLASESCLA